MENKRDRDMREAAEAGEQALISLQAADESLNSAKNWGLFDLFGGGIFSSWVKHSRLEDAAGYMEDARTKLLKFQEELKDIEVPLDFRIEIGSFLSFADFFLDGVIADYMVQSRITDAKEQIEDAMIRVQEIMGGLEEYR